MGVYFFDNPSQEKNLYKEIYDRQTNYKRTKESVLLDDSVRASSISKMYPNFSPDVISALTLLQVKPEAEVLAEVSARIAENNQRSILQKTGNGFKAGIRLGLLGLEEHEPGAHIRTLLLGESVVVPTYPFVKENRKLKRETKA